LETEKLKSSTGIIGKKDPKLEDGKLNDKKLSKSEDERGGKLIKKEKGKKEKLSSKSEEEKIEKKLIVKSDNLRLSEKTPEEVTKKNSSKSDEEKVIETKIKNDKSQRRNEDEKINKIKKNERMPLILEIVKEKMDGKIVTEDLKKSFFKVQGGNRAGPKK